MIPSDSSLDTRRGENVHLNKKSLPSNPALISADQLLPDLLQAVRFDEEISLMNLLFGGEKPLPNTHSPPNLPLFCCKEMSRAWPWAAPSQCTFVWAHKAKDESSLVSVSVCKLGFVSLAFRACPGGQEACWTTSTFTWAVYQIEMFEYNCASIKKTAWINAISDTDDPDRTSVVQGWQRNWNFI